MKKLLIAIRKQLKKIKILRLIYYKINSNYASFSNLNLNKDSIVLDLGANIGSISQILYDKYNCRIYCFEPNEIAFKILKKKFIKEKKIKCYNYAISNKNGYSKLYLHVDYKKNPTKLSTASSLLKNKENVNKSTFTRIKTVSIKNLLIKFQKIDLIKIDIEGSEYKILPEIIKKRHKIKKVICELHGVSGSKKNLFLNNKYKNLIETLKNKRLYNNWFIQHF